VFIHRRKIILDVGVTYLRGTRSPAVLVYMRKNNIGTCFEEIAFWTDVWTEIDLVDRI